MRWFGKVMKYVLNILQNLTINVKYNYIGKYLSEGMKQLPNKLQKLKLNS